MPVNKNRVRKVNTKEESAGKVVYWMNREIRAEDNWALLFATERARERGEELVVVYNLVAGYLGGGRRQWDFKLSALEDVQEELAKKNIAFHLLVADSVEESQKQLEEFLMDAGIVVTDFSPVRAQLKWVKSLAKVLSVALYMVDAHNIVPAWVASDKQEFAAYTLRPKLFRLLPEYLEPFPELQKMNQKVVAPKIDWQALASYPGINEKITTTNFSTGKKGAEKVLEQFLEERFERYADKRNNPLEQAQSDLSPYLHYGILSPQRVALLVLEKLNTTIENVIDQRKNKAKVEEKGRVLTALEHGGAFLEELIIRRELADNFCFYNKNYDAFDGFPEWAKKSLNNERSTKREFLYTKEEFEAADTHDELWNAAQMEMVQMGKMHGYMRMYWAKKILEWTKSPEEALEIAIYLNDKYSLDGRDPNGYAGITWSIGGVHDRAWFPRPVYGTVRYMARSGCEKKFPVKEYIAKWTKTE